ncbi:uncharacterized protein At4g06744-like [Momordica charantia]|uniref:Uncharacterized protein At4g06744-like n=1 Tax=Momordica charantia TaxID=3673 RepID=A0A6J1CA34_MOMCH|nr:uncharacterized protein At4g06744-like [Momordica charantia]
MSKIPPRVFLFLFCNLLYSFVVHAIANGTNSKTQVFKVGSARSWGKGCDQGLPHCKQQITPRPSSLLPVEAEVLIFEDLRLAVVYPVIQKFKSIITSDPLGITKTWVGSDICSYRGFYCDNPPDNKSATALASIDFNGFQLGAPSVDGFLDQLPDIAVFHANSNNFAGTISTNIAKLPYLYELDVSNNLLSGPFPTAVVGMNSLTFLDLRFNFFSGSVPAQIFVQDLDFLLINNNNFMQNLPASLSNTHILYLTLANNKFSGPIPGGIVKALSSLTEVLLLNNSLSGCLPYELGSLDEAIVFDAGNNRLTGPIPFSLGCLKNVEQLNFAGNLLYGMVPEVVCGLGNLVNLSLSDNYFTVVGPLCRILIGRGVLNIRNNCVPDLPFQRPIAECAKFLAFPRICPRMWSYTFIPCMLPPFNPPISYIPKYWPHFP